MLKTKIMRSLLSGLSNHDYILVTSQSEKQTLWTPDDKNQTCMHTTHTLTRSLYRLCSQLIIQPNWWHTLGGFQKQNKTKRKQWHPSKITQHHTKTAAEWEGWYHSVCLFRRQSFCRSVPAGAGRGHQSELSEWSVRGEAPEGGEFRPCQFPLAWEVGRDRKKYINHH